MSIAEISDPDRIYKKPFQRRNDSGELDVFEAARYFSGTTEISGYNGASFTPTKTMREDKQGWRGGGSGGGGRISLDMPLRNSVPSQTQMTEKQMLKEKKCKQPSSPGGRLASFLNSLFNQTSSKKKKPKSTATTQSVKDEDESPGGRRKRRSSISHFRSASATDSKSVYSSTTGSGFRTPPPYAHTPAKHVVFALQNGVCEDKKSTIYAGGLDEEEEFEFSNGFPENIKNSGKLFSEKVNYPPEEKKFRKFNEVDDDDDGGGGDSDSSSDLFELENYDLGCYSSGLPVYETTHMDSIKRGAPISNGAV